MRLIITTVLTFLSLVFLSCATTESFIKLELGMTKNEVLETIGDPDLARGSIHNKYDQVIEVWEYNRLVSNFSSEKKLMWVYFCNGHLVQWGEAGDWQQEADKIYEMRFR